MSREGEGWRAEGRWQITRSCCSVCRRVRHSLALRFPSWSPQGYLIFPLLLPVVLLCFLTRLSLLVLCPQSRSFPPSWPLRTQFSFSLRRGWSQGLLTPTSAFLGAWGISVKLPHPFQTFLPYFLPIEVFLALFFNPLFPSQDLFFFLLSVLFLLSLPAPS